MASSSQRPPQLGDWTVCVSDDKSDTTAKNSISVNEVDSLNKFNDFDWCIADCKEGGDVPYLYIPKRVYQMDTVIIKDTLEGMMPIPENTAGNCSFATESSQSAIIAYKSAQYTCSAACGLRFPPTSCNHYSYTTIYSSAKCPYYSGGVMLPLSVGITGTEGNIDFSVNASSAFEYLDIKITDWPRSSSNVGGHNIPEKDEIGWPLGGSPGEDFRYTPLGGGVFRIWAYPGGGRNGNFGPYTTSVSIRVHFTLMGGYDTINFYAGTFPGASRTVTVSYVGAGRRGNYQS